MVFITTLKVSVNDLENMNFAVVSDTTELFLGLSRHSVVRLSVSLQVCYSQEGINRMHDTLRGGAIEPVELHHVHVLVSLT